MLLTSFCFTKMNLQNLTSVKCVCVCVCVCVWVPLLNETSKHILVGYMNDHLYWNAFGVLNACWES